MAVTDAVREFAWRVKQDTQESLVIPILGEGDAPHSVSGWLIDAEIKSHPGGELLYTWPDTDASAIGDLVTLLIPAPVSLAWTWRTGWYRVKLTDPDSDPVNPATSRVLQGAIFLSLD